MLIICFQFHRAPTSGPDVNTQQQKADLSLISNDDKTCYSDGTGTRDKSNLGVQFTHSAPNSDMERDPDPEAGVPKRRSKRIKPVGRKNTRTGKEKILTLHNQD